MEEGGIEIDDEILAAATGANFEQQEESNSVNLDQKLEDAVKDMTYGRRLARHLSKYAWYNPHVNDEQESINTVVNGQVEVLEVTPPCLDSAWAYFEHYSLPRHLLPESDATLAVWNDSKRWSGFVKRKENRDTLLRAQYGERDEPTRLYNFITTPESEFADFGIGLAIYFWTVRMLAIIMFIAGCINIPTMIFFSSTEYSEQGQSNVSSFGVVGSAICTEQVWKACPTCTRDDWNDFPTAYDRFASSGSLTFILRNECRIRLSEGIVALVSLLFMCISIYIMGRVSRWREVKYDERLQTTSDYSLEVENPPFDAKNPDEWRDFFSQFGDVTFCSITLDNENLVKTLVQRRKLMLQIEYLLRPGVKFDKNNLDGMVEQCYPVSWWQKWFLLASDAPTLLKKIRKMEQGTIKQLAGQQQNASNVFITFETEQGQRSALKALSVRRLDLWTNKSHLPEKFLFRGKHLLAVREPPEPSSVRWQDLDEAGSVRLLDRTVTFDRTTNANHSGLASVNTEKDYSNSSFHPYFFGISCSWWRIDCSCSSEKRHCIGDYDFDSQSAHASSLSLHQQYV